MKLVGSPTSPFVRKIKICLMEKNLPFEWHETVPWQPNSDIGDFNPLGKVPAFVADDGTIWTDSPVIVEYIETFDVKPRMIPESPLEAVEVRQLESLADGICDAGVAIFLENYRSDSEKSASWITRQEGKLDKGLEALSKILGDNQYLHANSYSVADVAAVTVLDWLDFRLGEYALRSRHANLLALCERLNQRPTFAESAAKA